MSVGGTGRYEAAPGAASEGTESLALVLELVRSGRVTTRAELMRVSGLGRKAVTQRLAALTAAGLIEAGDLGPSTGGRMPREFRFRAQAGHVLVAHHGATRMSVALSDLGGRLLARHSEANLISDGPEKALSRVIELFDQMLAAHPAAAVWGIGIGVPGPVEFATGTLYSPPIMPGWDSYHIRERFADHYEVPTWVDNDVNLLALGEQRAGLAADDENFIFVKIGTGIGAGIIVGGRLYRGAQGVAGDIGHVAVLPEDSDIVCRCGNTGCLEAIAGGAALARDALAPARDGTSAFLARRLESAGTLSSADVVDAAKYGDAVSVGLLNRSGQHVGRALATLVNFFNPSLIALGGDVGTSGDTVLAAVRQTIYARSLPLATRHLRISASQLGASGGLVGGVSIVVDQLFAPPILAQWMLDGSPQGRPQLAGSRAA
jgi:glucokinase-like ROK family protein